MAAGRPKSIDNSKIFDVSKPGKSQPMGTSRPVIITRGNIITDPSDVSAPLSPPSVSRKVISPVSEDVDTANNDLAVKVKVNDSSKSLEESMTESPAATTTEIEVKNTAPNLVPDVAQETSTLVPASETEAKSADEEVKEPSVEVTAESNEAAEAQPTDNEEPASDEVPADSSSDEESPVLSDSASVDALAESTTEKKEEEKQLEEQTKREAELQSLIDSGKYFVPLEHDSTAKKSSKAVLIVLIIILLAGAAYVVIDAKVVKTSITLPFHLFRQ